MLYLTAFAHQHLYSVKTVGIETTSFDGAIEAGHLKERTKKESTEYAMGGTVGKLDNLRESVQAKIYCYGKPVQARVQSRSVQAAVQPRNVQGASSAIKRSAQAWDLVTSSAPEQQAPAQASHTAPESCAQK